MAAPFERNGARVVVVEQACEPPKLVEFPEGRRITVENCARHTDFLATMRPDEFGCLLLSAEFGLDILNDLKAAEARVAVIVIAEHDDITTAVQAIKLGAFDVLERPVDQERLAATIRFALETLAPSPRSAAPFGQPIDRQAAQTALGQLTDRQQEILRRIVSGQRTRTIALALGISERTADNHRAAIMKKMDAGSIAQLVQIALALA